MRMAIRGVVLLLASTVATTVAYGEPQPVAPAPPPAAAPPPANATPTPVFQAPPAPAPPPPVAAPTPAPAPPPTAGAFPEAVPRPERRIPDWRFVINNLFVFRYNPLGIEDQMRAGVQVRLFKSFDTLFRDTFFHFGIYPKLNPAFVKIGPSMEIQPLSMLNIRVALEAVEFFSTFGFLQSFPGPTAHYSDTDLDNGKNANKNYGTNGMHLMIEPMIMAKVGNIAIRDKLALEYWNMNVHTGDTVWYDATLDTLVPANGWVLTNDLDLLYVTNFGGTVGVRYSVVKPFYPSGSIPLGDHDNSHQRLGLILAYTFFDHGYTRFNKPTILAICSWYLDHRYRTGDEPRFKQDGAVPYVIGAFAFQSDLMQ